MFRDPVILYGSSISYFTGKMENYFRVKEITYERIVSPYPVFAKKMKNQKMQNVLKVVALPIDLKVQQFEKNEWRRRKMHGKKH